MILPVDVKAQVPWQDLEGVVILGLAKKGEMNVLHMSSVTVDELAFLTAQLQAHLTCLLGPMKEG